MRQIKTNGAFVFVSTNHKTLMLFLKVFSLVLLNTIGGVASDGTSSLERFPPLKESPALERSL